MRSPVVDVHCHYVAADLIESFGGLRLVEDESWPHMLVRGERRLGPITPRLIDSALLLEDMDRSGVDIRVLCTASWLFFYWAEASLGERFSRTMNERIAREVEAHPRRLSGLATVPLQDTDRAIAELERAVKDLGLRGVSLGTNVEGRYFDDPSLFPFLEAAQDLDVPLFFHPTNVAGEERLGAYSLVQMLGNPHETALSLTRLILGGVLERLPNLNVCFPHAGGSIAMLLGRIDHAWRVRTEAHIATPHPPSEYIQRCYFDSISHSRESLDLLLRYVPVNRVLLGSDYPWDMGDTEPVRSLPFLASLDAGSRAMVLGGNAVELLKLQVL